MVSIEQKQQAFLLKLSDALRPLSNPVEIEEAVTKLALDFMDADWCHYDTIDGENLVIQRGASRDGLPSLAGVYPISSFGLFKAALNTGIPTIIYDVHTTDLLDEELKILCIQLQNIAFVIVPVIKNGKPVGLLVLVQSKPRKWTEEEVQITIETAERTWATVERAKAEEALHKSEEKYRTLFSSIDEGVVLLELIFDENGKAVDWIYLEHNPALTQQTGMENVVGKRASELFTDLELVGLETHERIVKTGKPERHEFYVTETNAWFDIYFSKVGGEGSRKIICVYNNITERKEREERQTFILKLSDALRMQSSAVAIQETAMNILGEYMQVNRAFYTQALDDRETLIVGAGYYKDIISLAGTIKFTDFDSDMMEIYGSGTTLVITDIGFDERFSEKAKAAFFAIEMRAAIAVPLVKDGMLKALVCVHQSIPRKWTEVEIALVEKVCERTWDAAERAIAEEALRQSEEKYRTLFTSIDQGFVLCELVRNEDGKGIDYYMLELNSTYEKQTGLSKEMVLGKTILEVFPSMDKWLIDTFASVVINQLPVEFEYYFESTNRWHEIKVYPDEKDKFTVLFRDITERKQAQKKAEEAYKIANAQVRNLFLEAPAIICVHRGPQHVLELSSKIHQQVIGNKDILGKPVREAFPELEGTGIYELLDHVYSTGESFVGNEFPVKLDRGNGKLVDAYFNFVYQATHNSEGKIDGIFVHGVDVTEQVLTRRKIEESEFRYHEMIYSSPSLMCILKGEDLIIEIANDAILESWGKGEDVIGKSLVSVMPEIVEQGFDKLLLRVYKTGEPFYAYETPITLIRNGKNELMHYTFVYQAQRNVNGKIEGVAIIANEVTPQAELKQQIIESENRFRTMADASPVFIWTLDANGLPSYCNKTFLNFIGVSKNEDISDWKKIIHPDDVQFTFNTINIAINERRSYSVECRMLRADGYWRWVIAQGNPSIGVNNEFLGFVGSSVDIHEQKTINEQLEYIVAERTTELLRSNEDLQQFAHVASHDLKEPVRKIRTFGNRLSQEFETLLPEKAKTYLIKIENAATRLSGMIDGVLKYSSLDSEVIQDEIIDLNETIRNIESDLELLIAQKTATLQYHNLPSIEGYSILIYQLFYNLINNSLKFSKNEIAACITITSKFLQAKDLKKYGLVGSTENFVGIEIKDNGIGFNFLDAEQIFKTFSRLHSKDLYDGTGLGLSLCKKIVDRHGGAISAEGKEMDGATFEIILPVKHRKKNKEVLK